MKGDIKPDHIPVNKFQLLILGLPPITFTEVSGLSEELNTVDLPDRTKASGGNTNPVEFTVTLPEHHTVEQAAMELWYSQGKDPVDPGYKKAGTLVKQSISGNILKTYTLVHLFVAGRTTPDLDMANDGEMAATEFTMSVDDILPI